MREAGKLQLLHPLFLNGGLSISFSPIKKAITRSSHNSNGTFRSYKHPLHSATFLPGRNNSELDFLCFAEMDPSIRSLLAQPTNLTTTVDGKVLHQIPSYAIDLAGMATLVMVESSHHYCHGHQIDQLAAFQSMASHFGWNYRVVVGSELRSSPLFRGVSSLWRSHRRIYDDLQLLAVTNALRSGPVPISTLIDKLRPSMGSSSPETRHILSMAAGNRIGIGLLASSPVGEESVVHNLDLHTAPATYIPFRSPVLDQAASK